MLCLPMDNASDQPDPSPAGVTPTSIALAPGVTLSGIGADLRIHTGNRRGTPGWKYGLRMAVIALTSSGFHVMLLWRLGAFCHRLRLNPMALLFEKAIYHLYHCSMPCSVQMGPGIWIPHPLGIVLNSRARLGKEVHLRQFVEVVAIWPQDDGRCGLVGDRVQLQSGAILIRGAIVGEDAVVAARALVNGPVPPRHLAVGMPAKARPLRPEQYIHINTPDKPEGAPAGSGQLPPINDYEPREK